MKAFFTILKTEAKLAIRDGNMPIFGIAFPAAVMLLVGAVTGPESALLSFAGVASIGICAAGLMGIPLTFATYRHEKILKRFKVTPASPLLLFLAVSLIQALFALISGAVVFMIASFVFKLSLAGNLTRFAGTFLFVQVSVFSIGYLIASLVPDIKTANLICTLLYFPMLFLSGGTVPYEIMPKSLQAFSDFFPLTQGIKLLKSAVLGTDPAAGLSGIIALTAIAVVSYLLSLKYFRWE